MEILYICMYIHIFLHTVTHTPVASFVFTSHIRSCLFPVNMVDVHAIGIETLYLQNMINVNIYANI